MTSGSQELYSGLHKDLHRLSLKAINVASYSGQTCELDACRPHDGHKQTVAAGHAESSQPFGVLSYKHDVRLDIFLKRHLPSGIKDPTVLWLSVSACPGEPVPRTPDEIEDLNLRWTFLKMNLECCCEPVTPEHIDELALTTNFLSAKWMMYLTSAEVDQMWFFIATSVVAQRLGTHAKVGTRISSTSPWPHHHLVCVYTADYTDREDVLRIETELRQLGVCGKITYKPIIYTLLGLHFNNWWGIPALKYISSGIGKPLESPSAAAVSD